jgi:hypothetical protein
LEEIDFKVIHRKILFTKGEKRMPIEWINLKKDDSVIVKSIRGDTLVKVFRSALNVELINVLFDSTNELLKYLEGDEDNKRIIREVFHFGHWRDNMVDIQETKTMKFEESKEWIRSNRELWNFLNLLFFHELPELYEDYLSVNFSPRYFGAWATCALNGVMDPSGMGMHTDERDYRNGFCWVVPFGDFEGGELVFPDIKVCLEMFPGDIVYFRSCDLNHFVNPFTGNRKSLVLFSHNTMFFPHQENLEMQKMNPFRPERMRERGEI